jgi:DeoR family galactitol utilization operon repressor
VNGELNEREKAVMALLSERGSLSVGELSVQFGVSEVTVRSDLKSLEDRGLLTRTRGGAVPALHRDILERQSERLEEKTRIARAAAELVEDGDVVMIEAGTTTALVARYLTGRRDVHIVTNSTLAFGYARANPALQLTMTGGEFRRPTESLVGPLALETLARLNVRWAFVGTDGFSVAKGMTTHLVEGAEIVRTMKAHAEKTVLVADASKYGRIGFASVLPLTAVDLILTDSNLSARAARELSDASIAVKTV